MSHKSDEIMLHQEQIQDEKSLNEAHDSGN